MARDTHTDIVQAAIRAFFAHGYRKCSLGDLAREAGVSKATLYNHFDGKEEIYEAATHRYVLNLVEDAEARTSHATGPLEKLHAAMEGMYGTLADDLWRSPHALELLGRRTELGPALGPVLLRYYALLASLLEPHVADAFTGVQLLTRCARGVGSADIGGEPPDPAEYRRRIREVTEVVFTGLVALQPAR